MGSRVAINLRSVDDLGRGFFDRKFAEVRTEGNDPFLDPSSFKNVYLVTIGKLGFRLSFCGETTKASLQWVLYPDSEAVALINKMWLLHVTFFEP